MFGSKKRDAENYEKYLKEKKMREYNMSPLCGDSNEFLSYVEEYESVRNKSYDSREDQIAELLSLIAKQNLLILAELKSIWQAIPEEE